MSIAQAMPTMSRAAGARWLLLSSLALNLFFIGVAVAMAVHAPTPARWDPDVFVRVERLAAALPGDDAALLRSAMRVNRAAIASAQSSYHTARDQIRASLREDPFQAEAMRAAMLKTRAARQNFDQVIQGVFADLAPQLSSAARHTLADWRSNAKSSTRP
jgi:uncharacterized membrane protein